MLNVSNDTCRDVVKIKLLKYNCQGSKQLLKKYEFLPLAYLHLNQAKRIKEGI